MLVKNRSFLVLHCSCYSPPFKTKENYLQQLSGRCETMRKISPNSHKDAQTQTKGQQNVNQRNQCVISTDLLEKALFSINVMTFFLSLHKAHHKGEDTFTGRSRKSWGGAPERKNKATGYKLATKPQVSPKLAITSTANRGNAWKDYFFFSNRLCGTIVHLFSTVYSLLGMWISYEGSWGDKQCYTLVNIRLCLLSF